MKSSVVLSKWKINGAEALMMVNFWKLCTFELQRPREVLAVTSAFCVSYTDNMVVMFCEAQDPKGMVFKIKNFSNDGDKNYLAIKQDCSISVSILEVCCQSTG